MQEGEEEELRVTTEEEVNTEVRPDRRNSSSE